MRLKLRDFLNLNSKRKETASKGALPDKKQNSLQRSTAKRNERRIVAKQLCSGRQKLRAAMNGAVAKSYII